MSVKFRRTKYNHVIKILTAIFGTTEDEKIYKMEIMFRLIFYLFVN